MDIPGRLFLSITTEFSTFSGSGRKLSRVRFMARQSL